MKTSKNREKTGIAIILADEIIELDIAFVARNGTDFFRIPAKKITINYIRGVSRAYLNIILIFYFFLRAENPISANLLEIVYV